ncbi:PC4 and SFRS1-interacting protein-like [Halyomorpha halys]|uniref:PC4 and SFRS1-interacting protein-like n=1 Tax=Halyomorpha halys TaxID=286706 RepID=UPI0006D4DF88|nr:hepatoma-derived growth factor-related protein 2-like [Halyomorpha halys]XP_024214473.1 hepatoma-derived growth factor-related protein 2-like [Halyomorpha halys]
MEPIFSPGDKVFAKVRGYPPWPARIEGLVDQTPKKIRYNTYFYGSGNTAVVKGKDICSFVENKTKFGKPRRQKKFAKAMIQIEAELSSEEQACSSRLPYSTPRKSNTSISSTTKVIKRKVQKRKLNFGTVENQKKIASLFSNTDLEHKNVEVVSRYGRKIKPKRFAEFEDRRNKQRPVKAISKVAPVETIDKDKTSDDKNNIAHANNEKVKIPLGYSQPEFSFEQGLNEGKFKEKSYANSLNKNLESEETLPFDTDSYTSEWTKNVKQAVIQSNLIRTELIQTEISLLEIDINIRSALNNKNPDTKKCLIYLDKLSQLQVTALMLKKHPNVVHTIKKVRRYVGKVPTALTEEDQEFHKDVEEIRNKAEQVYSKFQGLFFFQNNKSFWDAFQEEIKKFDEIIKHLSTEEMIEIITEPE